MVMLKMLRDLAGEAEGRTRNYTIVGGPEMKNSGGIKIDSGSCV